LYNLWGQWAAGYHAVNIFFHGAFAFLVWRIFNRMGLKGALAGALLFALHPVAVESVTWISELKNVLSGTLMAASLLWLCSYLNLFKKPSALKPSSIYIISFFLFLCALAAKTTSSVLPVFALGLIYWRRGAISKSNWLALAPFFAAGLVAGLITIHVEKEFIIDDGAYFEALDIPARLIIAGKAIWFYLSKLVFPVNLVFIYPKFDRQVTPEAFLPLAAAGLMFMLLFLLRKKAGRGPLCAWTCYVAALFPALGFFDVYPFVYSYAADHFQYLAMPVFCIFVAGTGARAREKLPGYAAKTLIVFFCLLLAALTLHTWRTQLPYFNERTLWESVLKRNPDTALAHNNLATTLFDNQEYNRAIFHWQNAIRLEPDHPQAYINIGWALLNLEHPFEAYEALLEGVAIKPDEVKAWQGLGLATMKLAEMGLKTWDAAVSTMERVVQLEPHSASAHHNLGVALAQAGRHEDALKSMDLARKLNPNATVTVEDIYHLLMTGDKYEAALEVWEQLYKMDSELALRAKKVYEPAEK
jgi:tetratricopeptide (TPR) repeat protein